MVKIFSKTQTLLAKTSSFSYNATYMGDRSIQVDISSPVTIPFAPYDYLEYRGEIFELDYTPSVEKTSSDGSVENAYKYTLKFVSLKYELERCIMRDIIPQDNGVHYSGLTSFSFFGDVQMLAYRIKANLDKLYKGNKEWTIIVRKETEAKDLSFDATNCWNALAMVKSEFELNFTVKGRTITIGATGQILPVKFKYGLNNGLYKITRTVSDNQAVVTRLVAYGGSRNIPRDYNKKDLVPESQYITRLMLPHYSTSLVDYIESENREIYGLREAVQVYDDIYPSIEGTTATDLINAGGTTTATGRLDEIVAVSAITNPKQPSFNVWIKDLGFDINDHLTPNSAQLSVKDGNLGGYAFDITKCEIDTTKTGAKYKLTLNRNQDDEFPIPDEIVNMENGDHFVLLEIYMPEVYISMAEQRLLVKAQEYLVKYDHAKFPYSVGVDEIFMARNPALAETICEGDLMPIEDTGLGLDLNIIIQQLTIKHEANKIPTFDVQLSDEPEAGTLDRIQSSLGNIESSIKNGGVLKFSTDVLRTIFHPLGGREKFDMTAREITARGFKTHGAREGLISGKGAIIKTLANGDTVMEADYINVRKGIKASKLTISEVEIEGGITMTGAAKMQTSKVVDLTIKPTDDPQYRANTLRLYFDNQDGKINNHFRVGDQALTKSVNINNEDFQITHSWRVVKEVGADYIDVYKFNVNTFEKDDLDSTGATITVNREVDSGSGIPREGDVVVACGSISDENRRAYMIVQTIGINAPISEEWSYVSDFRPSAAFNLSKYSDAKQTIHQGDSFLWRTRKGVAPLLLPPEVWVEGTVASYPESYIINGSTFVCMGKDITETPSDYSDNWLKTSGKGDTGSKGDYLVQGYRWAEGKPQRPVGSSPEGWSAGSDRGVAIVDEASSALTDEAGAVLLDPYPASYRLWGSAATFDGATGEVVGEWSDPYQMTAEDGKDGQNGQDGQKGEDGKDVDPAVVDALQAEIDAAKEAAANITTMVKKSFTEIEGGLVLTQMLQTRNNEGNVTAGISGVNDVANQSTLPALWVGGPYTDAMSGVASIIFRHNGSGKIGMCEIVETGSLKMKSTNGSAQDTLLITNNKIEDISSGNASKTVPNAAFEIEGSQSTALAVVKRLPTSIAVTKGPVNLKVTATLSCESRGAWQTSDRPTVSASASAGLYLCTTGSRVRLGGVNTMFSYSLKRDSLVIDASVEVANGKTYWLEVEYSGFIEMAGIGYWKAALSASTMSWSYVDTNSDSNVQVCSNGLGVARSSEQQFQASINPTTGKCHTKMAGENEISGNTKIIGSLDAPGVLCAGTVNATGAVYSKRWGAKLPDDKIVGRSATGKFKLYHDIGHTDYTVTTNLVSDGFVGMAMVIKKETSYVEIGIAGLDGNYYNVDFDFICVGRN